MKKKLLFTSAVFIFVLCSCSRVPIEVGKHPAPDFLSFKKLTTSKRILTNSEILNQIVSLKSQSKLIKEYTIKSISRNNKNVSYNFIKNFISGISFRKHGLFTIDIVFEHKEYEDFTLRAEFEIEDLNSEIFIFNKNTKTITGVRPKYKNYFATATEVTFPDQIDGVNVEEIKSITNNNVFGNNYDPNKTIKTIHLPKNLKTLGFKTFYNCQALTSITLPNSLTTIGNSAFYYCTSLTVTIEQTNPAKIKVHSNAFDDVLRIRVPRFSLYTYKITWWRWGSKIVGY